MLKVNLKSLLKEKGMTMTELHKLTGITQNAISLLANGKSNGVHFITLEKIVKALNCNLDDLITVTEDEAFNEKLTFAEAMELLRTGSTVFWFQKKNKKPYEVELIDNNLLQFTTDFWSGTNDKIPLEMIFGGYWSTNRVPVEINLNNEKFEGFEWVTRYLSEINLLKIGGFDNKIYDAENKEIATTINAHYAEGMVKLHYDFLEIIKLLEILYEELDDLWVKQKIQSYIVSIADK